MNRLETNQSGVEDFLAAHGGPFYELQARLGLLQQSALRAGRRALLFIALAWGVPFLLSLPQRHWFELDQRSALPDGPWCLG